MKKKILTVISTVMIFVPWTILLLRTNERVLESPIAEIMIAGYAIFMIISGIFTLFSYSKGKAQNNLMKICLMINSLYAVVGVAIIGMMVIPNIL